MMAKGRTNNPGQTEYKTLNEIQRNRGNIWYHHYLNYLCSLTYQLIEWEGLPDTVDPRYLEMNLHRMGYLGFYKDEHLGYIASIGALSGEMNHYLNPTYCNATSPPWNKSIPVVNYVDDEQYTSTGEQKGVVIYNNDHRVSTLQSLQIFASDLAELKEIIHVNQNAQKTPVLIAANDDTKFSMKQMYNQYEGNAPAIFASDKVDPDAIKVFKTDVPYVVDKLNTQKNAVWNEIMTYLGIKNANQEKRERMITAEADSNDEQIQASANIFLKAREEACERINKLHPDLNVSVKMRAEIVQEFEKNIEPEGDGDVNLYNSTKDNN